MIWAHGPAVVENLSQAQVAYLVNSSALEEAIGIMRKAPFLQSRQTMLPQALPQPLFRLPEFLPDLGVISSIAGPFCAQDANQTNSPPRVVLPPKRVLV